MSSFCFSEKNTSGGSEFFGGGYGMPIYRSERFSQDLLLLQLIFKRNVGRPQNDIEITCLMFSDLISLVFLLLFMYL